MSIRAVVRAGGIVLSTCSLATCALPAPGSGPDPAPLADLPPPGYGTLRQDDVSISLRVGAVQLKVTPLSESVTRVTAPDTHARLSGLARAHAESGGTAFLVSFFSDEASATFVPEDLYLIAQGLRVRHRRVSPVTPGWGEGRLAQRRTEMAVYLFPDVDLESELTLVYGRAESRAWSSILPRVQAERARARARARG